MLWPSMLWLSASVKNLKPQTYWFVKKLDEIPKVLLPPSSARKKALALADCGLIGQFTGIWPSPKTIETWMEKNWKPLIKGSLNHFFCERVFFFIFSLSIRKTRSDLSKWPIFLGSERDVS
jgi:hypothetical protein